MEFCSSPATLHSRLNAVISASSHLKSFLWCLFFTSASCTSKLFQMNFLWATKTLGFNLRVFSFPLKPTFTRYKAEAILQDLSFQESFDVMPCETLFSRRLLSNPWIPKYGWKSIWTGSQLNPEWPRTPQNASHFSAIQFRPTKSVWPALLQQSEHTCQV